jgi:hypothetical protein
MTGRSHTQKYTFRASTGIELGVGGKHASDQHEAESNGRRNSQRL